MENKAGNSSSSKNRSNKKFYEENGNTLWTLFDVRLPALCQKMLTNNYSKYPQVTSQGSGPKNYLELRPEKPRLIKVKSAKCQADLITNFQVPEIDTTLAKVTRPKRPPRAKQTKTSPSERNGCFDENTIDISLPDLDFNEKGEGIKLDSKWEEKKIGTRMIKDSVEPEDCNVDKTGVNGSIVAQFKATVQRERTIDTRNSTAKTRHHKTQCETELLEEQNRTAATSQINASQCLEMHINNITDTNEISEPECLKEQTIITADINQIPVSRPEFSKEWEKRVQLNKLSETEKLDCIPDYKKHTSRTERKTKEVLDNHKHNNVSETESVETINTCIHVRRNKVITEPNRNNKSDRDNTKELDTGINYKNTASETHKNNASEMEHRAAQDNCTINDTGINETGKKNLSETVCTEELDNATNEKISKAGRTEEQDNIANDERNTSETMFTQQNNVSYYNTSVSEMHKTNAHEMHTDNTNEFTVKLDNTSKNGKINLRDSNETTYLAEWDIPIRFLNSSLDETKETSNTMKQPKNVNIKEKCNTKEEATSQMLELDKLGTREMAKQKEINENHKTGENETSGAAYNAARKHKQNDKIQQHQCITREKNDKTETASEAQEEQEIGETELNTGQIEYSKQNDIGQPIYRQETYDMNQPEYTKEIQIECRKLDVSLPKYRKEIESGTEPTELKQEHNVTQPKYKKECKIFQAECTKGDSNDEDIDNDRKLVIIHENLESNERRNSTSAERNYPDQRNTCETTDTEKTTSSEQESKTTYSKAKHDQEHTKEIIKWKNHKSATSKAKIETNKGEMSTTSSERHQQTTVHPKPSLTDYRPEDNDYHYTEESELPHLECQEISIKLPKRNDNMTHQVAQKCNTGTCSLAFDVDTQAIIVEKTSPLFSILAETAAISDFVRKANPTRTKGSTNNDSTKFTGNEILVLLPPVCNKVTKKPTHGISGTCDRSSIVTTLASNCTKTPAKESKAFVQMISRHVSAYILDRKTNTARILPLDSSISYTDDPEDSGSEVFSEDILFQNRRLLLLNSEVKPRRVSSTDCRYFQSNPIEKLCSGLSQRSRSENLTRRCALNKEWEVLTKTTREELIIFSQPKQSSIKITETLSSQDTRPKSSVNVNSNKLQNNEALQAQQVVHESIHLQPFCPSISVDKKSDEKNMLTEFSQSQRHHELPVNNVTSLEKPVCCSRGTKTGNDLPSSNTVQKSATELVSSAMQQGNKELTGNSMLENLETQTSLEKSNCSSFDMNTSNKLTTKTLQKCDETSMTACGKTNKNPYQLQDLPEICMKTNHEEIPSGSKVEHSSTTDAQTSECCGCDREIFADLNSNQSDLTKKDNKSIGGKIESYTHTDTPVFVEVIDLENFTRKDVMTQCKTYESREVFTQTEADNFTQLGQLNVTQHKEHRASGLSWHPDTEKTKFNDGRFASADNTGLQQTAYSKAHSTKHIQDENTKHNVENLDFIQSFKKNNSTLTDYTKALQTEISFGGLIAKELAGYIFCTDQRNSRLPFRRNIKKAIKRSSSLTDVQTDVQNTLVFSEKFQTLLETGQTVLVLKLPSSDNC